MSTVPSRKLVSNHQVLAMSNDPIALNERYVPEKAAANLEVLSRMRTYGALLTGAVAGLLGLTGLYGFLFFIAAGFVVGLAAIAVNCPNQTASSAFIGGRGEVFALSGITSPILTYVLVWMVVYDCVYVF